MSFASGGLEVVFRPDEPQSRRGYVMDERFQELFARVRAGDPDATRVLFENYGDLLLRVVRKHLNPVLRAQVDSADFVQEAWLALLQSTAVKQHFDSPQQFGAFLATVARNKVVDIVRRGLMSAGYNVNREVRLNPDSDSPNTATLHRDTPSKSVVRRELKSSLVQDLGPAYRKIGLRIFDGIEPSTIAEEFGVSQRTVERVRKRIEDQLKLL